MNGDVIDVSLIQWHLCLAEQICGREKKARGHCPIKAPVSKHCPVKALLMGGCLFCPHSWILVYPPSPQLL